MNSLLNLKRKLTPKRNRSYDYANSSLSKEPKTSFQKEQLVDLLRQKNNNGASFQIKNTKLYTNYSGFPRN